MSQGSLPKEEPGFAYQLTEDDDDELYGVSQANIKRYRELERCVCKIIHDSKGDLKQELTAAERTHFHKLMDQMADILDKRGAAEAAKRCMSR